MTGALASLRLQDLKLKRVDKLLIGLCALVFFPSTGAYLFDYPLIRGFFESNEGASTQVIGYLVKAKGSIVRQMSSQSDFRDVELSAPLYNMDLVVTGEDSEAYIQFDAGGFVKLGPDSMVRLSFVPSLALGGVAHLSRLEVVTGKVEGHAGKKKLVVKSGSKIVTIGSGASQGMEVVLPPPSPEVHPTRVVRVIESQRVTPSDFTPLEPEKLKELKQAAKVVPIEMAQIKPEPQIVPKVMVRVQAAPVVDASEVLVTSSNIQRKVSLKWSLDPPDSSVQVAVRPQNSESPLFTKKANVKGHHAEFSWISERPGTYFWEILDSKGKPLEANAHAKGQVEVDSLIALDQPASRNIAGIDAKSNRLGSGSKRPGNFGVKLKWDPIAGADQYQLRILSLKDKVLLEKKLDATDFTYSPGKVFSGKRKFEVSATLKNGYTARLPAGRFSFKFLAPILADPKDGITLSKKQIVTRDQDKVMLTWETTLFTTGYKIELARDKNFSKVLVNQVVKENYLMTAHPSLGDYWWRVTSLGKKITSKPSPPNHYSVGP